jgi:X-Pro dipeptidyl-peptidase
MGQKGRLPKVAVLLALALVATGLIAPDVGARSRHRDRHASPAARIKLRNGKTQPVFSYKNAIRETIYIESEIDDDGKPGKDLLATDIIRPRETKTDSSFDVPVIYEMSPYYQEIFESAIQLGRGNEHETKAEEDGDYVPSRFPLYYDNFFVPRGYAVVLQDMPGTRNSEGCMVLGGNGELAAAKATMKWLRGKGKAYRLDETTGLPGEEVKANWSTGKVGMIGKSYDGTIANAAASMGLRGLKTIVPIGGISRWYDYMWNRGVQYTGNTGTAPLFMYYIDQPPGDDEEAIGKWVTATFGETAACEAKGTAIAGQADASSDHNDFWDERDYLRDPQDLPPNVLYSSMAKNLKASVFVAHGFNDFNVKPNHWVQWYKALKKAGVPHKLWLSQTGHVDPFDFRRGAWVRTLHRWFDRWLHGLRNGIMSEPTVDIERKADVWKTYKEWPNPRAHRVRLWLGPKDKKRPGVLTRNRPGKKASQTYTDGEQFESEMVSGRKKAKDDRLIFLTKKLDRKVHVSGEFPIKITGTVDRPDTNFTYLLVDYGRDLRVNHESSTEGISTSATKQSCHGKSTKADDACYYVTSKQRAANPYEIVTRGWLDARHRKSIRSSEPLTPGETYKFGWKGFGEDYVFHKGHRIGVIVAGSDSTFTIPDGQQATVDVNLHKSKVILPVVGRGRGLR